MNYDEITKQPLPDEEHSFYRTSKEGDTSDTAQKESINAKSFLSIVSPTSNISTYDHLRNVISEILRLKVENSVEIIEDISRALKDRKFEGPDQFLQSIPELDETVKGYINEITAFLNLITKTRRDFNAGIKSPDDENSAVIDEEDVSDNVDDAANISQAENWHPAFLHDVNRHMFQFRQNGVGLDIDESYQINLAIKILAVTYKLDDVRFWGKIFGTNQNYYVAEVSYTEGIPADIYSLQYEDVVETSIDEEEESKSEKDEKTEDEETAPETDSLEEDENQEEKPSFPPPIPPLPKVQLPPPGPKLLMEKNGKGVNKYMYFVTNFPGQPWKCLPQLMPEHITEARLIKRFLTGNLKAEVRGCTSFAGVEAHLLRAQIARISSSTILAPSGRFRNKVIELEDEQENNDIPEEETPVESSSDIEEDPEYKPLPRNEMMTNNMDSCVHMRQAISSDGCCSWKFVEEVKPSEELENPEESPAQLEDEDEDDDGEIPQKLDENPIPLLRSIAQDKGTGKMIAWTMKISSMFLSECGVILARSNLWPGAYSYFDGTTFENVYIGYGYKASSRHYAPVLVEKWQEEYATGSDILEPEDEYIYESEEIQTTGENSEEEELEKV